MTRGTARRWHLGRPPLDVRASRAWKRQPLFGGRVSFVGPAGHLIDELLGEAGISRGRGKRRLHPKPTVRKIAACQPWLLAEIEAVGPRRIVCLGATAAQTLLGKDFRLTQQLGQFQSSPWAPWILATYHPAAVLRAPTEETRHTMRDELLRALRLAAGRLAEGDGR